MLAEIDQHGHLQLIAQSDTEAFAIVKYLETKQKAEEAGKPVIITGELYSFKKDKK